MSCLGRVEQCVRESLILLFVNETVAKKGRCSRPTLKLQSRRVPECLVEVKCQ